jgi:hypothetical protein
MPTTLHVTNFKNKFIDMLTGVSAAATPFGFVNYFNGAQPADPSVAPVGAAVFAAIGNGPGLAARMAAAGGGITQLAAPTAPTTPAGAAGVAGITFARIYTTGQAPLIDTTCTVAGGGGGVIIDNATSTAGVGPTLQALGFQIAQSLGTLGFSMSLANRMADIWGGANATTPNLGNTTGGSSQVLLYSGAAPASADLPATGTLLATYNMTATNLWAAAVGGSAALNGAGPSVVATATGTAAYYRFVKNNGTYVFTMQGTVGTVAGASDMILSATNLVAATTNVQITDATISV